jgi:hypothetical protein
VLLHGTEAEGGGRRCDQGRIVFHHNLPAFLASRMSWLKHPVLRKRQAMQPPAISPLPTLTPIKLRSPFTATDVDDDELINPDDLE